MLEISTFFPQDFHGGNRALTNNNEGFVEFSTKSPSVDFSFFCEKDLISLIFLIFCLDKGVHFTTDTIH